MSSTYFETKGSLTKLRVWYHTHMNTVFTLGTP